jgi:hypothetical protein
MRRPLSLHVPAAWSWALLIWLSVRLVLSAIGAVMLWLQWIPDQSPYGNLFFEIVPLQAGWQGALLGVWQRWDAIHYMRIASYGYFESGLLAFFPLYPLLSRLVSIFTGGNILLSMLLVSNAATIAAFALLYQLAEEISSARLARLAVIALAVYPAAIYLYAPYPESLALCLILVAYQAARLMRWKTALLAGIAAGLSQPIAAPAIVLIAWEVWQKRQFRAMPLAAALGPAIGVSAYFTWLKLSLNRSYVDVQYAWGNSVQWPWRAFMNIPELFRTGMIYVNGWGNILAFILAAVAAIWSTKHLPRSMTLFQIVLLLMLLITSHTAYPLNDFARHTLVAFPLFIVLAMWYQQSKHIIWGLSISAALFVYCSIAYFRWQ